MEFSVVIATKDRRDFLAGALESLQAQTDAPPFEVIVVDNGSTDGTRGEVEAYANASRPVRYLWQPEPNRGKSRNRGVEVALGRYIAFCDDDVRLPTAWLAAHAAAQTGDEYVVNGPILNVASADSTPKPAPANYSRAFLCTCNASLAKRAFERAGGFDESFDLYGWEDTELGVRLRESGCRWRFAWSAYLWHLKPDVRRAHSRSRRERRREGAHGEPLSRQTPLPARSPGHRRASAESFSCALPAPRGAARILCGHLEEHARPSWLRALSRGQLLDGLYARELVRALDAEHER